MPEFTFVITTPAGRMFHGPAESVVVPGAAGMLGVLAGHAPMMAATQPGPVSIRVGAQTRFFGADQGVLDVRDNEVVLLTAFAEEAASLEEAKAKAVAEPENLPE